MPALVGPVGKLRQGRHEGLPLQRHRVMSPQFKDVLTALFILLCFGVFFAGAFVTGTLTLFGH